MFFTSLSAPEEKTVKVHDYSQKSIEDFKLIFVNLSPKLTDQEKRTISTSFVSSSQDQSIEINAKRILNHVFKLWNKTKSCAPPSTCALTSSETVAMKIYSI